jgi:hypothetical protein
VYGAGAGPNRGVIVLAYSVGEERRVEARFVDAEANTLAAVGLPLPGDLKPYAIPGYVQIANDGLAAGALPDGRLLLFDRSGGRVKEAPFPVSGVHRWQDTLYAVGLLDGRPMIARIDEAGNLGAATVWTTSERFAARLAQPLGLVDDRTLPSRASGWDTSRTAIGERPFVSPFSLDVRAEGATGWIAAGPSIDLGGEASTMVAYVPVGVSYP